MVTRTGKPALPDDPDLKSELLLWQDSSGPRAVLAENGQPVEQLGTAEPDQPAVGDIWLGRVSRIVPALSAVFVEIDDQQDGLLSRDEASPGLREGQPILVQIHHLMPPGKGHQLTTRLRLAGPFAVWQLDGPPLRRSKLRDLPPDEAEALFTEDLARLAGRWQRIDADATADGRLPRRLYSRTDWLETVMTTLIRPHTRRILVQGGEFFASVYQRFEQLMPTWLAKLELQPQSDYSLPFLLGLPDLDRLAGDRQIWLRDGGRILIEPTETLTAIDVNSGRSLGQRSVADLRLRTNLAAAAEIARQLRLRRLSGLIVIDFIKMKKEEDRQQVEALLRQLCRRDRAVCRLGGFTRLGLFELSRSRL